LEQFFNRTHEIQVLRRFKGKLCVIFGRRRIGKSYLIRHFAQTGGFGARTQVYYTQAIEGSEQLQVSQLAQELVPMVPDIPVTSWNALLKLLANTRTPSVIILDEFPYFVKSQPSLPSMLQKWMDLGDASQPRLVLLGSSQTMMHGLFLDSSAPLYERASEILRVPPMSYADFCKFSDLDPRREDSYLRFSLVGGVPKYWEYLDSESPVTQLANELFFESGARLESEPDRLLKDENIHGEQAKSILEAVGRGAHRPFEIAGRLQVKQPSLSRPLQVLKDAALVVNEKPFGENDRSAKRSLYKIVDHSLAFWFGVYSPRRSLWLRMSEEERFDLVRKHAAQTCEWDFRRLFPDAQRYWESRLEFDSVRYADSSSRRLIVSELKFHRLKAKERKGLLSDLAARFKASELAKSYEAQFEVLGSDDILQALHTGSAPH
jgi:AAA+ ATPase superfamily predicted ATPase